MSQEAEPKKKNSRSPFKYIAIASVALFAGEQILQHYYPDVLTYICLSAVIAGGGLFIGKVVVPLARLNKENKENTRLYYEQNPDKDPKVIKARKAEAKAVKQKAKKDQDVVVEIATKYPPLTGRDNRVPHYREANWVYNHETGSYQSPERFFEWQKLHGKDKK